jgi:hypothetical protein
MNVQTKFKISDIEIYNATQHPDYFELTAYITRENYDVVRVDIYPKIGDKVLTTYESFLVEEVEDMSYTSRCDISKEEWEGIVLETKRKQSIEL